ncbi:Rv1733c family protein [Streptomyces sp. CA-249302]|uniref:Rv1733c family protein n=1 Tax=Streptomyces sp. CA-249302 TaxID=3240058 RepID=UPI003D8F2B4B
MAFRGPKVWLWRWRRNPLKRRADAVEAWVVLGAWAVTVLAGVLAGLAATQSVEHGLARERVEWRKVEARLTEKAPGTASKQSGTSSGDQVWGKVHWMAPNGSGHTGQVRVRPGSAAGTPVAVWTDPEGRLVTRPATVSQAHLRAALIGCLVGVSAAVVPFVGGRVLRGRMESRRIDQWDTEWARFDPLWGRKTS